MSCMKFALMGFQHCWNQDCRKCSVQEPSAGESFASTGIKHSIKSYHCSVKSQMYNQGEPSAGESRTKNQALLSLEKVHSLRAECWRKPDCYQSQVLEKACSAGDQC